MRKTLRLAVVACMVATSAMAQLSQIAQLPQQKMAMPNKSIERCGMENFKALKSLPLNSMKMDNHSFTAKGVLPITTLPEAQNTAFARAAAFKAYYERPAGVYNIKAGFAYTETGYSRHGILAPIYQDVVYRNASTSAVAVDWLINGKLSFADSALVVYLPGGTNFYEPMPELTAYALTDAVDTYQYGYCLNPDSVQAGKNVYDEGQAVTVPFGMVHNLDVGAESFYNTYIATKGTDWTQMLFGYDKDYKPSYVEIFEKPLGSVVLSSVYTYIATPVNYNLTDVDFSMYIMTYDESTGWSPLTQKVTAKPGGRLGQLTEECDVWHITFSLEKPVIVNKQFGIVLSGPQDGSAQWAFMHQNDRSMDSYYYTAGYIPTVGEYAGYLMPYALNYNGAATPYPASIDMGLQVFMPYNMVMDTVEYQFLNYGDYIEFSEEGTAGTTWPAYLWNWYAFIYGSEAKLRITSNADWLSAEVITQPADDRFLSEISISVEPLPDGMKGRAGVLTIIDNAGYESYWKIVQGDAAAGIEGVTVAQPALDPNAPVYDLTGRQVANPAKGVYIQNGRKFVVK